LIPSETRELKFLWIWTTWTLNQRY